MPPVQPGPPVQLSESSNSRRMALTLADIRYLFEAPAIDPMAGSHMGFSGLDEILARLKREKLPKGERLQLHLSAPADQIGATTQTDLGRALSAYATAQIAAEENNLQLIRRETAQSLRVGGLFLAACLILAALVDHLTLLPPFVQSLLRESLVIAGWVGLWHPLDLLLYSWWPNRYRIGLLKHVKDAELSLQPA